MVSDLLFLAGLLVCLASVVWTFWISPPLALFFLGVLLIGLGLHRHLTRS